MLVRVKRSYKVALLLAGSAILLCSCAEKKSAEEDSPYEGLMTEYSTNRTITATENGKKKYEFFTPLLEGYTAGAEPYREFRKGVRISTYKADSSNVVDVTLTANYAIYYENRKLWEAKGNVVVKKSDGKELYTEQLFWNAITKKIYSNVDSKIVQPDGEFFVSSFESDEEFRYWSSREMDGRMEVEFKPVEPVDSLQTEDAKPAKTKPAKTKPAEPAKPAETAKPKPEKSKPTFPNPTLRPRPDTKPRPGAVPSGPAGVSDSKRQIAPASDEAALLREELRMTRNRRQRDESQKSQDR